MVKGRYRVILTSTSMVLWRRSPIGRRYRVPQILDSAIQTSYSYHSGNKLQLGNGYNTSAEQNIES